MHCVLVGNYGVENLGDEALKDYFLKTFAHIQWTVISAHPQKENEVSRLPGGIRSLLTTDWMRTIRVMRQADAVVFGGGSLFTDVESSYACFLWWIHATVARLLGTKVFLAFQGIGPFKTKRGEWFARSVASKASFISVRDVLSKERMQSWTLKTEIVLTFDPVYAVMYSQIGERSQKVLTIIPRKNSNQIFIDKVKELSRQSWDGIQIISMEPEAGELVLCSLLKNDIGDKAQIHEVRTLEQLSKLVQASSYILSQRYHGALAAFALGVPFESVTQGEGDKLSVFQSLPKTGEIRMMLFERVKKGEQVLADALKIMF